MSRPREGVVVALAPARAMALWSDPRRWPAFVEGFARLLEDDPAWPEPGARVVWLSGPGGRGRVTEQVVEAEPARRFATRVFEERLMGVQTAWFAAVDDERTEVVVELDYRLTRPGPAGRLLDLLFVRRAVGDVLARTLRRFAIEADEEALLERGVE